MKTLDDLEILKIETLRFNVWEKYGKRRIYINAQSDMKLFIYEDKDSEFNTNIGGMYINNVADELLFEEIDIYLSILGINIISREQTFDDIIEILESKELI